MVRMRKIESGEEGSASTLMPILRVFAHAREREPVRASAWEKRQPAKGMKKRPTHRPRTTPCP